MSKLPPMKATRSFERLKRMCYGMVACKEICGCFSMGQFLNTKRMLIGLSFLVTVSLTEIRAQELDRRLRNLSDAPSDTLVPATKTFIDDSISYGTALRQWKTVEDVANWMKHNFRYDMERAKLLSENSRAKGKERIYAPSELYRMKSGVCVDLSRFAVETINHIDAAKHPQYLLIEFEPLVLEGNILRNHWTAIYQDATGYFIFADSKRPGAIEGPYTKVEEFISEYQEFRNRKVISWRILPSYQKKGRNLKSERNYH